MLAVVDDADNVLSAAAFTNAQDAEFAEDFAYTLLVNLGLVFADVPRPKTREELLDVIKSIYKDYKIFVKDLAE